MSRNISSPMLAELTGNQIAPCFLAIITFRSATEYVWTGPCPLTWNGNTFTGIGSLGKISPVAEGVDINAEGMTLSLSGIDPALLAESVTDVQVGAPVTVYFALVDGSLNIIGTPYPLFVGQVDQPSITPGTEDITISLKCESRLSDLQRANQRRYTSADQRLYYPDDIGFSWVEILNDQALRWG